MTRVRDMLERSRRSLVDGTARQRLEGSTRQLWERSRATVAQIVAPPPPPKQGGSQDVLAGICSSVALRDLNLVDSLLEQLEKMEANEDDPDALARLYKLDHLATRLRRNGENLRVLAGRDAGGSTEVTTSMLDVARAALSSIEHYPRVELGKIASLGVVGFAADDVSRLLAELLDNATSHSPPTSTVTVSAHLTERGSVLIRVEDTGIGLPPARLAALNERLGSKPVLDRESVRHMGLAVVRSLSSRHGISVWLAHRSPHGTVASALLPTALVQEVPVKPRVEPPTPRPKTPPQQTTVSGGLDETGQASSAGAEPESPTTRSGLPRRVPQSLKDTPITWPSPADVSDDGKGEGHGNLLDDLDAFAEGEQAARSERESQESGEDPNPGEGQQQ